MSCKVLELVGIFSYYNTSNIGTPKYSFMVRTQTQLCHPASRSYLSAEGSTPIGMGAYSRCVSSPKWGNHEYISMEANPCGHGLRTCSSPGPGNMYPNRTELGPRWSHGRPKSSRRSGRKSQSPHETPFIVDQAHVIVFGFPGFRCGVFRAARDTNINGCLVLILRDPGPGSTDSPWNLFR